MADCDDSAVSYTLEAILACSLISTVLILAPLVVTNTPSTAIYDKQSLFFLALDSLTLVENLPPSELSPPLSIILGNATLFSQYGNQLESCLNMLLYPEVGFRLSCAWGFIGDEGIRPGAIVQYYFLDTYTGMPRNAVLEVWYE